MKLQTGILATAITAAIAAPTTVSADDHGMNETMGSNESSSPTAMDDGSDGDTPSVSPYAAPDGSWISISGEVADVRRDEFDLDYGDGMVTVEMDDGDRDADAYKLLDGDKVRVLGRIDDDFLETTSIEASSVQLDKLGTTFYADPMDEETLSLVVTTPIAVSEFTVQGTVIAVDDDDFTLDTGMVSLTVDVEDLATNPLDDEGFLQIDVGDRVGVTGNMTSELFEGRQLDADVIVELTS